MINYEFLSSITVYAFPSYFDPKIDTKSLFSDLWTTTYISDLFSFLYMVGLL